MNQHVKYLLVILYFLSYGTSYCQFLSNLDATRDDALFTTYASPLERSEYRADQGYQLLWNDDDSGIELISSDGGNTGIAFRMGNETRFRLSELYREPVVTLSYSDIVKYYYYPFKDLRVAITFNVYSSRWAIEEIQITNEGEFLKEVSFLPYFYAPSPDSVNDILPSSPYGFYRFGLKKYRDAWMKEHDIPLRENYLGIVSSDIRPDSVHTFLVSRSDPAVIGSEKALKKTMMNRRTTGKFIKGLIMERKMRMEPGDRISIRIMIGMQDPGARLMDINADISFLNRVDPAVIIRQDEKEYSRIPDPGNVDRDKKYFFWSCFTLLRQCMMPPEAKCHYNYYIFSREPKWGWGYGGQVFHESLSMLAYAYMDPEGAMNSQRIYIERQKEDGYINYRTGPYLDETIEYKGKPTTSAPWFNYENLEIYKITKDRKFLAEAYTSGKKFYDYFVAARDSNNNGLCEWGGDAGLESVRDARVVIWDKVGWPGNLEGPDVNSMLVKEALSLAEMAALLDLPGEASKWKSDAASRRDLINRYMWDTITGFYYNVNRIDQTFTYRSKDDLKRKEIIGFLPLWAGITDRSKTDRLLKSMLDTAQFGRKYGIPTLSAADDYYAPMGYWNGPVWVQWDYLIFRGLLDNGYRKEASLLSDKVLSNMIWNLKNDHVFWEFYSPDDHQAGWNRTYIWAGIAARFILDLK